jgi:hypothetical protein
MNWILLGLFGASCLLLMFSSLRERSGILQFPFLAGAGAFGFLFVQAFGVVRNGSLVPEEGLVKTLLMCVLCNLAVFLGWNGYSPEIWRRASRWVYPLVRLYWIGILFLAIGAAGQIKLIGLAGGLLKSFSIDNEITNWQGLPIVYLYIAGLANVGVVMVGLVGLKMRSPWRLVPAAPFVLLQAAVMILFVRRSPLITLGLTTLCIFYFARHALPPKAILVAFAALAAAAMFIFPLVRGSTQIGADRSQLENFSLTQASEDQMSGKQNEFWGACYLIQITDAEHLYMLGAGFYNDFIRYFVPKLFVGGTETKDGLYLNIADPQNSVSNSYGWTKPNGFVPTGPASVYIQFSYAGAALFWFLARGMKYLWIRALNGNDRMAQCLYILLLTPAVAALVNDFTGALYANGLQIFIAPLVALLTIRMPNQRQSTV